MPALPAVADVPEADSSRLHFRRKTRPNNQADSARPGRCDGARAQPGRLFVAGKKGVFRLQGAVRNCEVWWVHTTELVGDQAQVLGWCSEDSAVRIRREDSAVRIRVGFWRVCVGFGAVDGAAQGGDQLAGFVEQSVGNA